MDPFWTSSGPLDQLWTRGSWTSSGPVLDQLWTRAVLGVLEDRPAAAAAVGMEVDLPVGEGPEGRGGGPGGTAGAQAVRGRGGRGSRGRGGRGEGAGGWGAEIPGPG
jgi:hypothetical protein